MTKYRQKRYGGSKLQELAQRQALLAIPEQIAAQNGESLIEVTRRILARAKK